MGLAAGGVRGEWKGEDDDVRPYGAARECGGDRRGGGYEVGEYDVSDDYETTEYDVSEYKSVYD